MRNGLYFGLYRLDNRFAVDRYFCGKDWHYVDFAKIAEFYRDIDAKDPELHWDFGDTLGFFDLAESDVRDEDVEHGDPAQSRRIIGSGPMCCLSCLNGLIYIILILTGFGRHLQETMAAIRSRAFTTGMTTPCLSMTTATSTLSPSCAIIERKKASSAMYGGCFFALKALSKFLP